jgi:ATP-dependent DNA helicase PIF1
MEGKHALAAASSGIAAVLLEGGRTFHSRFKAPLSMGRESPPFAVKLQTALAELIRRADLILWDEAPMMNRHYLEGLDAMLRDVMGSERPFGGKCVVVAGDFRQTLPVVKRGGRAQTVRASHKHSILWRLFTTRKLEVNMRVRLNGQSREAEDYAEMLLRWGNGEGSVGFDVDGHRVVEIPEKMNVERESELIEWVFPEIRHTGAVDGTILCTRNNIVDAINAKVSDIFPGDEMVANSADELALDDQAAIPVEYLNSQAPSGMPPHVLRLKEGMPVMLLRNLDPHAKLCNGTRMTVKKVIGNVLLAAYEGGEVLIPRIPLQPKENDYPFRWTRRQFPIRPAFAMTVNKSQGQTIRGRVGVFLPEPVFSHGQLYVAASRVVHPDNIRFCVLHRPPEMDESRRAEIPIADEDRQEAERLAREEAEALFADEEEELALLMGGDEPDEDEFAAMLEAEGAAEMDDEMMLSLEDEYNESRRLAPGAPVGDGPDEDEEDAMQAAFGEAPRQPPPEPPREPPREPPTSERPPPPRAPTRVFTRNVVYVEALQ